MSSSVTLSSTDAFQDRKSRLQWWGISGYEYCRKMFHPINSTWWESLLLSTPQINTHEQGPCGSYLWFLLKQLLSLEWFIQVSLGRVSRSRIETTQKKDQFEELIMQFNRNTLYMNPWGHTEGIQRVPKVYHREPARNCALSGETAVKL